MPVTRRCLPELGFEVAHTPGIARAWRYEFPDGCSLLVTNAEGFDLPEPNGPFSVILLSHRDEMLEATPLLFRVRDLYRFVRKKQRHFDWKYNKRFVATPISK